MENPKELRYFSKRLILLPLIWGGILLTHVLGLLLLPDTPAMWVGLSYLDYATPNTLPAYVTTMGHPVLDYCYNILHGDFGSSIFYQQPVLQIIYQALPITVELSVKAFIVLYTLSVIIAWGKVQNRLFAQALHFLCTQISAVPSCLLYILVFVASYYLSIALNQYAQICAVAFLVIRRIAPLTTFIEHCLQREAQKPYITYARHRNVSEVRVWASYLMRNALIPVWIKAPKHLIQIIFTGTLSTEVLFGIDGFGQVSFLAMKHVDYPLVLGCLVISSIILSITHLAGDLLHTRMSPHIQIGKSR